MSPSRWAFVAVAPFALMVSCGSNRAGYGDEGNPAPGGGDSNAGLSDDSSIGSLGDGAKGPGGSGGDPVTCQEAEKAKSYLGCDYWPTVTANPVQSVFDFAVAVANVGKQPAKVTVTGNGVNKSATVQPGALETIFLPWVDALKGGDNGLAASILAAKAAYHLVSDVPVVVYQFNPIEFKAQGGEPGKSWSSCRKLMPTLPACYSYSNDASLLLPSTAMTGAYRIMGAPGFSRHPMKPFTGEPDLSSPLQNIMAPFFTVTATQDGTNVTVKLGAKGKVVAGGGVAAKNPGDTLTLTMNAGDVAEIVSGAGRDFDFSGSLLLADKPVQVISGVPCMDFPLDVQACDHVEEVQFPAETLGKHYVVMTPSGPKDNQVGHVVRLYGNADGTTLTYKPSKPAGCPASLEAGQVADCGEVTTDFEVEGNKEFGVAMFMLGGQKTDPTYNPLSLSQPVGDPSQSYAVTVEQYRKRYIFLAPTDYTTSYVDIVSEPGSTLMLDGKDVSSSLAPIAGTGYARARIKLDAGKNGVHELTSSLPAGIQVMGYGDNTSYQYPGGLNLGQIAAVPPK